MNINKLVGSIKKMKKVLPPFFLLRKSFVVVAGISVFSLLIFGFWHTFQSIALNPPTVSPPTGGGAIGVASGAPANSLYMSSTGKVGIGTAGPNAMLELSGSTAATDKLRFTGMSYSSNTDTNGMAVELGYNATNNRQLWFTDSALAKNTTNAAFRILIVSGAASIGGVSTDGSTNLPLAINSKTFFPGSGVWDSSGNVGIGTTDPGTYKLYVNGAFYASGSSRDYKQNITGLELDSSKIYQLEPKSFDYKPEYEEMGKILSGGRQFGLVAEDVYKIYPELTLSDGKKTVANVDYEKLPVLLLAEMKNQKKEIDTLKQENNELKLQLENLMERIESLGILSK